MMAARLRAASRVAAASRAGPAPRIVLAPAMSGCYNLLIDKLVTFSFDLGSPYGYLAAERVARGILGVQPEFEPVLLGAIFRYRGRGSWAQTEQRERNLAEIEARACRYGLPPFAWPNGCPGDGLAAMRAATWAKRRGAGAEFALAASEIKAKLRETTDAAWSVGVRGVPTVRVGDAVFYGDDELERAAEAAR